MITTKRTIFYICAASLLAAVLVGLFWHTAYAADTGTTKHVDKSVALALQDAFTSTSDEVKPSVVYITAEKTTTTSGMPDMGGMFPGFPFGGPGDSQPQTHTSKASGSGVIVRSDGYVMTNDHVVAGADRVTVHLSDGREFVGKVMEDTYSDIAVVKIDAKNLPAATLGNSDKVKAGQWAMAVGSPFGLQNTVTIGVVSALTREAVVPDPDMPQGGRYYPDLIQTDASINPGNSGGPLLNINGEVIGINTMIESPSGANAGIGFAIPVNSAKFSMDQLISSGKVVRGFLGLGPMDITPAKAKVVGVDKGAFVDSVSPGSPAEKAGIKAMDVITQIGSTRVISALELRRAVAAIKPGTKVNIDLVREGKKQSVECTVGEASKGISNSTTENKTKIGLQVQELTPDVAGRLGIDAATRGVVVKSVDPASAAGRAVPPIQAGDVIIKMNWLSIKNVADFNKAVAGLKSGDTVLVQIVRQDSTRTVEMSID